MRLVVLSLLLTNCLLAWHDRVSLLERTRVGNTNLARAVAERVEASLAEIDHVIAALVELMDDKALTRAGLEHLQPMLVSSVSRIDQLDGLFIRDATGRQVATSEPLWDHASSEAADASFQHHRVHPSTTARLSAPVADPLAPGRWILPLSRRIDDVDGRFAGVVLATVNIPHLGQVLERFDIDEGAITLTVAGQHLVRRPALPSAVGTPAAPPSSPVQQYAAGFGDAPSPIDGVQRLFSYESTRSYPVQVVVASTKSAVLQGWWISSTLQTVWVLWLCFVLQRSSVHARQVLRNRQASERSLRKAHASLADANGRLRRMAQFDELTSLPNRRYFDRRLARAFKSAQRDHAWIALVMVDVDLFKTYNDRYGHQAGDRCLASVAGTLRSALRRPQDFVARYGGEEIVLLLPGADGPGALAVAQSARRAVLAADITHPDNPAGRVTISLGVAAAVPGAADSAAALLKRADDALYAAKRAGRNQVAAAG